MYRYEDSSGTRYLRFKAIVSIREYLHQKLAVSSWMSSDQEALYVYIRISAAPAKSHEQIIVRSTTHHENDFGSVQGYAESAMEQKQDHSFAFRAGWTKISVKRLSNKSTSIDMDLIWIWFKSSGDLPFGSK